MAVGGGGRSGAAALDLILEYIQGERGSWRRVEETVTQSRIDLESLRGQVQRLENAIEQITAQGRTQSDRRFGLIINIVGWVIAAVAVAVSVLK